MFEFWAPVWISDGGAGPVLSVSTKLDEPNLKFAGNLLASQQTPDRADNCINYLSKYIGHICISVNRAVHSSPLPVFIKLIKLGTWTAINSST